MMKTSIVFFLALLVPLTLVPKPKEKLFKEYSTEQVFQAALAGALENFSISYVDDNHMWFAFHAGAPSKLSAFDCSASVVKTDEGAKLIVNFPQDSTMFPRADRIADALFKATEQILEMQSVD